MKLFYLFLLLLFFNNSIAQTKVSVIDANCGSFVILKFIFDDVKYVQFYEFGKLIKVYEVYGPETHTFKFSEWSRTPLIYICDFEDVLAVYFESRKRNFDCQGSIITPTIPLL